MPRKQRIVKARLPLDVTALLNLPATIFDWEWELLEPVMSLAVQRLHEDRRGTEEKACHAQE